ncbi:MAG TPA: hypothetical protein VGL56_12140 [Fimbriimonadaceae bacterium]
MITLLEVTEMLRKTNVEFVIGGSLASSVWGQERTTHDADVAVLLNEEQLDILAGLVKWPYIMDTDSIRLSLSPLEEFASGNILNGETLDKIDLFLLSDSPYTQAQMRNRRYIEVAPDKYLPFLSPEDTIIVKLRWFVLGNRVSDRQWNDIVQVLEIQRSRLDEAYLNEWSAHFGIMELLLEARKQVILDSDREP